MSYKTPCPKKRSAPGRKSKTDRSARHQATWTIDPRVPAWQIKLDEMLPRGRDRDGCEISLGLASTIFSYGELFDVMTEDELARTVERVHANPKARAMVKRMGVRALIAMFDATNHHTQAGNTQSDSDRESDYQRGQMLYKLASDILAVISPEQWESILALRQEAPKDHERAIVALIDAVRPRLAHVSNDEAPGEPHKQNTHKIGAHCHYTSKLLVTAARQLGIPAKIRSSNEFADKSLVDEHSFPWFPTLGKGFRHGDDPYSIGLLGELLVDEATIQAHWRDQAAAMTTEMTRIEGEIDDFTPTSEVEDRAQREYLDRHEAALTGCKIHVVGIEVTAHDAFARMPTRLFLALSRLSNVDVHLRYLEGKRVKWRLNEGLREAVAGTGDRSLVDKYLPWRTPRLPETFAEAVEVVIRVLRERAIRDGAVAAISGRRR
ncbi:MAG: hypothetical protein R6X02_06530 [Enhygromyxa sp.]